MIGESQGGYVYLLNIVLSVQSFLIVDWIFCILFEHVQPIILFTVWVLSILNTHTRILYNFR